MSTSRAECCPGLRCMGLGYAPVPSPELATRYLPSADVPLLQTSPPCSISPPPTRSTVFGGTPRPAVAPAAESMEQHGRQRRDGRSHVKPRRAEHGSVIA